MQHIIDKLSGVSETLPVDVDTNYIECHCDLKFCLKHVVAKTSLNKRMKYCYSI